MSFVEDLHTFLLNKNITISVAESCTAGLIGSSLTTLPGSSKYFLGGVIAYNNVIKTNILGVSQELISQKTEVSKEVAQQMAKNICLKFNSNYSLSTTGYAGPSSVGSQKVGTVFIAVSNGIETLSEKFIFKGNRREVIDKSTYQAIEFLYSYIKKHF
tara:strand:+ start:259 stop:732 length:474 start_codon:yes stop_codon:yes gene_type:complete